jgi:hypothetical protein
MSNMCDETCVRILGELRRLYRGNHVHRLRTDHHFRRERSALVHLEEELPVFRQSLIEQLMGSLLLRKKLDRRMLQIGSSVVQRNLAFLVQGLLYSEPIA